MFIIADKDINNSLKKRNLSRGLNFFYSDSVLETVYENTDFLIYYKGIPLLSEKKIGEIIKNFDELKDKKKFLIKEGSYLIIVFDKRKKALNIYRDAWGTTPIYYFNEGEKISITDSLTDLINLRKEEISINYEALVEYLCCSYIVGSRTLYKNVYSIRPLYALEMDIKTGKITSFSNHEYPSLDRSIKTDELSEELERLVDKSIKNLSSVIPKINNIFVALSGGTDSSLLVSKMREIYNSDSFICGTVEYENWKRNDTPYFKKVVDTYNLKNYIEVINNRKYATALEELINKSFYIYHTFAPSFYSLTKSIREKFSGISYHVNGTGPDEAVIGFEKIPLEDMRRFDKIPRSEWITCLFDNLDYFYTPPEDIKKNVKKEFFNDPYRERRVLADDIAQKSESFSEFQRRYAMQTITDHHIRMLHHISLLNGMETILPYCTQELFDLSFKASYYEINPHFSYKYIYKKILLKYFDKEFVFRPKIGFHAPSRGYFKEKGPGLNSLLNRMNLDSMEGVFDINTLNSGIRDRLFREDAPMDYFLWAHLNLFMLNDILNGQKYERVSKI